MKIRLNEAYETPTWIHVFLFVSHTVTVNGTSISMSLSTPKVIKSFTLNDTDTRYLNKSKNCFSSEKIWKGSS